MWTFQGHVTADFPTFGRVGIAIGKTGMSYIISWVWGWEKTGTLTIAGKAKQAANIFLYFYITHSVQLPAESLNLFQHNLKCTFGTSISV